MHTSEELQSVKRPLSTISAPPLGQSHGQPLSLKTTDDAMSAPQARKKRYAKTLRLTSDQLVTINPIYSRYNMVLSITHEFQKSLNLKPGANTITFSLSATGVTACTARLFVWDHTDRIVISDIDGTITKYVVLRSMFLSI